MKVLLAAAVFLFVANGEAFAQKPGAPSPVAPSAKGAAATKVTPEKDGLIRQLLDVTGTQQMMETMLTQMISDFAKALPSVEKSYWAKFRQRTDVKELVDLLVPIYDKHYSAEEIRQLLAFYQTPLGQKLIRTTPQVSQESYVVGREWGQRKGEEVARDLRTKTRNDQ